MENVLGQTGYFTGSRAESAQQEAKIIGIGGKLSLAQDDKVCALRGWSGLLDKASGTYFKGGSLRDANLRWLNERMARASLGVRSAAALVFCVGRTCARY